MKGIRVTLSLFALSALPMFSAAAQGNSTVCTPDQARVVARARANGEKVPPGLAKKCPPPPDPQPPPPDPQQPPVTQPPPIPQPPTGIHWASGTVYEDVDGNGSRDPYAGEMGLAGWTVQLLWNGSVVASTTTDDYGYFEFRNLGDSSAWAVCVVTNAGYVRTQPLNGDACGGAGYTFTVSGTIETMYPALFGVMLQ